MLARPRRSAPVAGALLLAAALTACGSGDSDDDSGTAGNGIPSEVVVLDQAQVDEAVLSPQNLGPGFTVDDDDPNDDPEAEDEDSTGLGCLAAVDDDLDQSAAKAEASYVAATELETPAISSGVSSYDSLDDVTERFERLRAALADCEQIDVTEDGATFTLEVEHDEETSAEEVDEQLNISAIGSASAEGLELPVAIRLSAARIDNDVVFLSRFDLGADGGELEPYTAAAIGRLLAVLDGTTPSDETVVDDAPGGAGETA
ncbi:hypothetical protein GGQ22_14825 [Nocardioides sp. zg-579]|uniref:Sensor domain-containing protein n=1 Tax=Nocardioides marmotae TaxID=2663857 RepID=A0A6I3JEB7_9ACTN|nr:hypothetical protein [Nocardioides marmotae]MCR6032699.1 hypothetical protein [Gordonia jinghuaiqii]MTB96348.1 hypothetical protein [Nocardioides marmotae]QKE03168.1 hypothetical protein HPC71_20470 [Nocardioides marmotae]